jgi:ubiquitin-protein ligase
MSSTSIATKRASKEIRMLTEDPPSFVRDVALVDNNVLHWSFTVIGPPETPYANGKFKCECVLPVEYPTVPPSIKIMTKVFNPNIESLSGKICEGFLAHWSPSLGMRDVMEVIATVFTDFSHGAVNEEAGKLYERDQNKFLSEAANWTKKYA